MENHPRTLLGTGPVVTDVGAAIRVLQDLYPAVVTLRRRAGSLSTCGRGASELILRTITSLDMNFGKLAACNLGIR